VRFAHVVRAYYSGMHVLIAAVDLVELEGATGTDAAVAELVRERLTPLRDALAAAAAAGRPAPLVYVVGTKIDAFADRQPPLARAHLAAQCSELGGQYYECSAVTGEKVAAPFEDALAQLAGEYRRAPVVRRPMAPEWARIAEQDGVELLPPPVCGCLCRLW
jgi:hypothetical protein